MRLTLFGGALCAAAAIAVSSPVALRAQAADSLRLSLEDAVARVLRSSDEARIADALVELADAQVTAARAAGLRSCGSTVTTNKS